MDKAQNKPNLFIVGAAKSGTTSLWYQLKAHPDVYMYDDELYKEPAYFSQKGSWMQYNDYLDIFKNADEKFKWIGDASTAYLTDPTSAKRIKDFNPEAKIIISLRNPAVRAYSLYNWMVQDGYEYMNSFEEALNFEEERIHKKIPNWFEPEYYWNYLYFHSGLYYQQVKRYIDLFGKNVLVVKFENLKNDFSREYEKICLFLSIKPNKIFSEILNPSKGVFSASIQFILKKTTTELIYNCNDFNSTSIFQKLIRVTQIALHNSLRLYLQKKIIVNPFKLTIVFAKAIKLLLNKKIDYNNIQTKSKRDALLTAGWQKKPPEKLNNDLRKTLLLKYEEDVIKLEQLIKIGLDEWLY